MSISIENKKSVEESLSWLRKNSNFFQKNKWDDKNLALFSIKQLIFNSIIFDYQLSEKTKIEIITNSLFLDVTKSNLINQFENNLSKNLSKVIDSNKNYLIVFFLNGNRDLLESFLPIQLGEYSFEKFDLRSQSWIKDLQKEFWFNIDQFPKNVFILYDKLNQAFIKSDFIQYKLILNSFNQDCAIDRGTTIINYFRFALNFPFSRSLVGTTSVGEKSLSKFKESPFYLIKENGLIKKKPTIYLNQIQHSYQKRGSQSFPSTIGLIKENFTILDKALIVKYEFLLEIIQLFQKAIDQINPNLTYLYFWQTLEKITLFKPTKKHKVIICRLKNLLNLNQKDILFYTLDSIKTFRHDFVHSGIDIPIYSSLIFFLKHILENCIQRLFILFKEDIISSKSDLDDFYKNFSKSKKDLSELRGVNEKIIDYIISIRKK